MVLGAARTAAAEDTGSGEGGRYELETGQEGQGEYQLHGPGELTTPEEFLSGEGEGETEAGEETEEGEGEGAAEGEEAAAEPAEEAPSQVSLELELEEEPGELPPVHPVQLRPVERLRWFYVPPFYYQGIRGNEGTRLFFPFFFQSWTAEGRRDIGVLPFYWQTRGPGARAADVAFPLVWYLRGEGSRTLVVANAWTSRGPTWSHAGFAPLAAWGHTAQLSYQVAFPLFWRFAWNDGREFWLGGPTFYHRNADGYRAGFFPLVWAGERGGRGYGLGLPLVYHFWNRGDGTTLTVVPPVYARQLVDGWSMGVAPLLFAAAHGSSMRLTLAPIFHYDRGPERSTTFISPLAWYRRRPGSTMGGVLLYHWARRQDSRFDALLPLYFHWSNSTRGSSGTLIPPFIYWGSDPVRQTTVFFPIVWRFRELHQSDTTVVLPFMAHSRQLERGSHTTWVFPSFQYTHRTDGYDFNIHPLLYIGRDGDRSHQVFAPLFWRFARPTSETTILFPVWWDFERRDSRFQAFFPVYWHGQSPNRSWTAVLNSVWISGRREGTPYWSFHFFPLFSVGRPAPGDLDWRVLHGLFGAGHRGDRRWVDLFWVPVEIGGDSIEAEPAPSAPPARETAQASRDQHVGPGAPVSLPHAQRHVEAAAPVDVAEPAPP